MEITPELHERLVQLKDKYAVMGQDMNSYIDGLLYADYLTYWDYVHLDVLLNLQTPRTPFPDEQIFIMYHQITELYFKLARHAIAQVCDHEELTKQFFIDQLKRVNSYFKALTHSFDIMVDGMYPDQFLKFRMALLPASGFQSAQYRMIEIASADVQNMVAFDMRGNMPANATSQDYYDNLYWKRGATELASGQKTLTLKQFEKKYTDEFLRLIDSHKKKNLWQRYLSLSEEDRKDEALIDEMRRFDSAANIKWPMVHYKSAVRYLQRKPADIKATGGTNWQNYLPARSRRVSFFPELWTEEEILQWGRKAYEELMGVEPPSTSAQ